MTEVTQILSNIEQGQAGAAEKLLPLVYHELRRLAAAQLIQERPGHTLQATALVHEAYLRLVDVAQVQHWNSRGHFFVAAAEAMRRILIDQARARKSEKRGGAWQRVDMEAISPPVGKSDVDLLELNEALDVLAEKYPRAAKVVQLRYFAGLTIGETAAALGIADSTTDADWAFAKSWLQVRLGDMHDTAA